MGKTTSLKKLCGQFGKRLEQTRIAAGVTVNIVAEHLCLDVENYIKIERGNVEWCLFIIPLDREIYDFKSRLNKTIHKLFSQNPKASLMKEEVKHKAYQIYRTVQASHNAKLERKKKRGDND